MKFEDKLNEAIRDIQTLSREVYYLTGDRNKIDENTTKEEFFNRGIYSQLRPLTQKLELVSTRDELDWLLRYSLSSKEIVHGYFDRSLKENAYIWNEGEVKGFDIFIKEIKEILK